MPPSDGDLLAYFFHRDPIPEICDVCAWVVKHEGADLLVEHTQTRLAIAFLIEDLRDAGHPLHISQLAVSGVGFPGPDSAFEPRHWFWAVLVMPGFEIGLNEAKTDLR